MSGSVVIEVTAIFESADDAASYKSTIEQFSEEDNAVAILDNTVFAGSENVLLDISDSSLDLPDEDNGGEGPKHPRTHTHTHTHTYTNTHSHVHTLIRGLMAGSRTL